MNRIHKNLVGMEIKKQRHRRGWSQSMLATQLQTAGLNISRSTLAKIECGAKRVGDLELLYLALALKVSVQRLFPPIDSKEALYEFLERLLGSDPATSHRKAKIRFRV